MASKHDRKETESVDTFGSQAMLLRTTVTVEDHREVGPVPEHRDVFP